MTYKKLLFIWLIIVMFSVAARAQTYSEHLVKHYKVSDKSTVEIFNKYGKVHVIAWEKDSVKFEVDMRISASDQKKLNKLKGNISFDFTSTNYYVIARTQFVKSGGIFSDVVETIIPSNNVSIDYTVYIPSNVNLRIDNKFGDVYIDDFNGNFGLVLSNGALKANSLNGNTSLQLNSADAMINNINSGSLTLRYSDVEFRNINKLDLDTKFSKIEITEAGQLKINSRRDSYTIEKVGKISGKGDFTKMNIIHLGEELSFSNKYYSLIVEDIDPGFSLINITTELTDVELRFPKASAYNLDVTHHPEVQLTVPTSGTHLETKELNDENRLLLTYGTVGKASSKNLPKVKIVAERKCIINLFHR
jgi:hypothetical protein